MYHTGRGKSINFEFLSRKIFKTPPGLKKHPPKSKKNVKNIKNGEKISPKGVFYALKSIKTPSFCVIVIIKKKKYAKSSVKITNKKLLQYGVLYGKIIRLDMR